MIFQDSLPLGDRAYTDILQRFSASYERISTTFFGGVGRGPMINRLDVGGGPNQNLDPGFLNPDQNPDPDGYRWYVWQVDSTRQVLVTHLFEVKRSTVKVGVSFHYFECQSSSFRSDGHNLFLGKGQAH